MLTSGIAAVVVATCIEPVLRKKLGRIVDSAWSRATQALPARSGMP
jgi:hypothetical protein